MPSLAARPGGTGPLEGGKGGTGGEEGAGCGGGSNGAGAGGSLFDDAGLGLETAEMEAFGDGDSFEEEEKA